MDKRAKLEAFFDKESKWKEKVNVLRDIALSTEVEETYKWQFPTYTVSGKNVFALARFKDWYGIWFFQGVFLKDRLGVLTNAQEGKTKAMRHWKFMDSKALPKKDIIAYMEEAIQNQLDGKVVTVARAESTKAPQKNFIIPPHLVAAFKEHKGSEEAFKNLSIAKQRGYVEYIDEAKREATKIKRLDKIIPLILEGKSVAALYGGK